MGRKAKPALSDWLIARRKARGESVEDVAKLLDRSPATIRGWEAGRPPASDDPSVLVLERHFGATAPQSPESGDQSALVAAIENQTAAISALVDLLRPLVEQGEEDREARLRAVEAELRMLRGPRVGGGSPGRPSPLGSAG